MSALDKSSFPEEPPKTGGVGSTDFSSSEQAVPVPWWIGPAPLPLTWIVPEPYNVTTTEIKQKVGKKNQTTGYQYYADVAGIAGLGLGRRLRWIEADSELVWQGNIERPDNPSHPNYHAVTVTTKVGTYYITWGRWDQPADTILLGPLGARNPALRHPAYRGQVRVVIKKYYCGTTGAQVPNTRICMEREPQPAVGNFPAQNSAQGESILAGLLELATNPIFGAEIPASMIDAAEWEKTSRDVVAAAGCHAPFLDRAAPLRDLAREFATCYDGFFRIDNGRLRPGFFPRGAALPENLSTLGIHDFVERPSTRATALGAASNTVTVTYRDSKNLFAETPASASASDHVTAVDGHEPRKIEMLAIIDPAQAQRCADDAAALAAEGEETIEGAILRTPRAVHPNGEPLLPGDLAITTILAHGVEAPVRVTRRADPWDAEPEFDFTREPGSYPQAASTAPDERPAIETTAPQPIAAARVLELTPALAGTPLGLPVAILAQRPVSASESGGTTAQNIIGFSVWYSPAGASYDWLGSTNGWSVRATLAAAVGTGAAELALTLALDAGNIDDSRLDNQSATARENDTLLLVVDDEIFSVGGIIFNEAGTCALACLRARCGTRAAAHAVGAEAWLVYRDELASFTHATFAARQTRNFKLQPFAASALELEKADAIEYTFRDRGPEAPVIVIEALPLSPKIGVAYQYKAAISDINGDLDTWRMAAVRIVDGAVVETVQAGSGTALPAERASLAIRGMVTFPRAGDWQIVITAADSAEAATEARSEPFAVAARDDGSWGDPLPGPPPVPAAIVIQGGFETLNISWSQASAHAVAAWELCAKDSAGQIAGVTHGGIAGTSFLLAPAEAGKTKYVRVRALGANGIPSEWSAESAGAALAVSRAQIQQTAADLGTIADRLNDEILEREARALATTNALAGAKRDISALVTARDAVYRDIANILAVYNDSAAGLQHLSEMVADGDSALARDIASLHAILGDTAALVQVLTEAFVDSNGHAIARWGVTLDAAGTTAEIELYAQGGPDPISRLTIKGDMQSKHYATGQQGWFLGYDGRAEMSHLLLRDSLIVNTLPPPSFDPPPCAFNDTITITPTVHAGHKLIVTFDGTPPNALTALEWPGGAAAYQPLTRDSTLTIRARTCDEAGRISEEVIATYVRINGLPQVATPVITPNAAAGSATTLALTCATPGATILYQLNGAAATTYAGGALAIAKNDTITTHATKPGHSNSASTSFTNTAPSTGGGLGSGSLPGDLWGHLPLWKLP